MAKTETVELSFEEKIKKLETIVSELESGDVALEEAINICKDNANEGDAVLLSPACASWGMFKNYEERGDMFKKIVNEL